MSIGVLAALGAAVLFGCSVPLAKPLLAGMDPWLLAGLLYLGSGIGLWLGRRWTRAEPVALPREDRKWFLGALVAGGMVAPVLLMSGLSGMPASSASLLLNSEGVFTALLAWFVFQEAFDRRIALGMGAIVVGAVVLSWPDRVHGVSVVPALAVLGACLAWGLDNNLTRKVALADASFVAMAKGLVAGSTNLALALVAGAAWPPMSLVTAAMLLGLFSYGVSLVLFVHALRHLGAARTGAYFGVAPFFGALLSVVLLDEAVTARLLVAGGLMACGVYLHLTEDHEHEHTHEVLEHSHEHRHDEHHDHEHDEEVPAGTSHSHWHRHEDTTHSHPHYPDLHHQHRH